MSLQKEPQPHRGEMLPFVKEAVLGIEALVASLELKNLSKEVVIQHLNGLADGLSNPHNLPETAEAQTKARVSVEEWLKANTHTEASMQLADQLLEEYPELAYVGKPGMVVVPDADNMTNEMMDGARDYLRFGQAFPNTPQTYTVIRDHLLASGVEKEIIPEWLMKGGDTSLTKSDRAILCYALTLSAFLRKEGF